MQIHREWAMPNQWTFTIKPIKELLNREVSGGLWVDPFAGMNTPAKITNDLNPDMKASSHVDALSFLRTLETGRFDGALFDPPYSITQSAECYKSFGKDKLAINVANIAYWKGCKDEIARIVRAGGKVICCGWSTNGLGKGRGFVMTELLIVPHGGSKNDTLVTVEIKQ